MSNQQGKKRPAAKDKESWKNKQSKKVMPSSNIISMASKRMFGAAGANSVIKINRTAYPVPDCLITKMKVSNTFIITTGASGAFSSTALAPNSAYDPFAGAGSAQARFFDQLMALYASYCVYGVKAKVKFIKKNGGTQDQTVRLITFPSRQASCPITSCYNQATELPYTLCWDVNGTTAGASTPTSGPSVLTDKAEKSHYFEVSQFFGRDRQGLFEEANFSGGVSSNPTNLLYYYVCVEGLEAAQTDTIYVEVAFTQYVTFREVLQVGAS